MSEQHHRCFMGDCAKLDRLHPEHCVDIEAQMGIWGMCLEFEERDD